jgi:acyl-CoA synthetase (AMP-forming)/AMP-acid ligase II
VDGIVASFERNVSAGRMPTIYGRDRSARGDRVLEHARVIRRRTAQEQLPLDGIVALQAADGPGLLSAFVGLRAAGHPVLLLDFRLGRREVELALRALGAVALVRVVDPWADDRSATSMSVLRGSGRAPEVAVVKLTSGSSGEPRGVAVSPGALASDSLALCAAIPLCSSDRILAGIPWSHSYGFSVIVGPALLEAVSVILPDGDDPVAAAHRHGATFFPTVPAYLQALLHRPPAAGLPPTLSRVMSAGAPLQPPVAQGFRERFGVAVQTLYGASECGAICFDGTGRAAERGTVGTPLPGVRLSLRRVRGGRAVTVRSRSVADGYLPEPAQGLRAGRFASDDLAAWRDGELTLLGRANEWINVDGHKVHPREVEAVLRGLKGVDDAAVVARSDGGRETVHAVIACRDRALRYAEVREWCRRHLAPFKVPRSLEFRAAIPYTQRGKPDRAALERAHPAP